MLRYKLRRSKLWALRREAAGQKGPPSDRGPRQNDRSQKAVAQARNVTADLVPPPSRKASGQGVRSSRPLSFASEDPTWCRPGSGFASGCLLHKVAGTTASTNRIPATPAELSWGR